MKAYAVIDTNVLVSSLLSHTIDSPIVRIVSAIRDESLIPMFNDEIMAEYIEVLGREKFNFDNEKVEDLLSLLKNNGINCTRQSVKEVFPDPDDIVFYEVAMSREDSYLVTGNLKHFPKNGRVVSPADMLYIIEYGKKDPGLLNQTEGPYYLPIPLEEINAIIREVRTTIR